MGMLDLNSLGITVFIIGVALLIGVLLFQRFLPRIISPERSAPLPPLSSGMTPANSAILLVKSGGRVIYINKEAREWFGLLEEDPNLERLARRTRPSEVFMGLCAAEGQARFSLHGRFVEGQSYFLPYDGTTAILVSLRRPPDTYGTSSTGTGLTQPGRESAGAASSLAIQVIAGLHNSISASFDLDHTIRTILESAERLIASDFLELTLWDEATRQFTPYRFVGLPGVSRRLEKSGERYSIQTEPTGSSRADSNASQPSGPQAGFGLYTGLLAAQHAPLLIGDTSQGLQPGSGPVQTKAVQTKSFLGIPLEVGGRLLGTLELASLSKDAFTQGDLENMRFYVGPAAVALHNALLYQEEQRRTVELAGLAKLAGVAGLAPGSDHRDSQEPGLDAVPALPVGEYYEELYRRLVENIQNVLEVESLGFWIWDENLHSLEAQQPFIGFSRDFTDLHHLVIPPGSQAEAILAAREMIVAQNAVEDECMQTLGLHLHAQAAGIHSAILAPLVLEESSEQGPADHASTGNPDEPPPPGRLLGYLQVADKRDGQLFDQEDIGVLVIIAGHSAAILENAALARQFYERSRRSRLLHHIASLAGSSASLDEILASSLEQLAQQLRAESAFIFLNDFARTGIWSQAGLRLHRESLVAKEVAAQLFLPVPAGEEADLAQTALTGLAATEPGFPPAYQRAYGPILEALHIQSAIFIPLIARDRSLGNIVFASQAPAFFHRADLAFLEIAARQLAGAIEGAVLRSQTDDPQAEVGQLRERVEQLTALARVSQELNALAGTSPAPDLERLLQHLYDEVLHATGADCGTIMLFDVQDSATEVSSDLPAPGYPEDPPGGRWSVILHIGDPHDEELTPLECSALSRWEAYVVEEGEPSGPDLGACPNGSIRSSLLAPIFWLDTPAGAMQASQQSSAAPPHAQVLGLIHMHAQEPARFNGASLETVQALAVQAAIALLNTQRYQEQVQRGEILNRRVETLANLLKTSRALRLDQPLERSFEAILSGITESTSFKTVLISLVDPQTGLLKRVSIAEADPGAAGEVSPTAAWFSASGYAQIEPWLTPEFRLGARSQGVGAYFIPSNAGTSRPYRASLASGQAAPPIAQERGASRLGQSLAWDQEDLLLVHLADVSGRPVGLIFVGDPHDGLRPNRATIETLEIFGSQAVLIIESHQKYIESQQALQELHSEAGQAREQALQAEREMERARQAAETVQSHLPALLRKDLEQTLAIQRLSQRARWIRAGLQIAEVIARASSGVRAVPQGSPGQPPRPVQASPTGLYRALGQEILARIDGGQTQDILLVAEPGAKGPRLVEIVGEIPQGANPEALLGQRNPLRSALSLPGEPVSSPHFTEGLVLAANLEDSPDWQNSPLLQALGARSFICFTIPGEPALPSQSAALPQAAVLLARSAPLPPFLMEDYARQGNAPDLVQAIFGLLARQAAQALQALRLQAETVRRLQEVNILLDFSRQLGSPKPAGESSPAESAPGVTSLGVSSPEILNILLDSARRLIPAAHAGMVALYDPEADRLIPQAALGYSDNQRILEIVYRPGEAAPGQAFEERRPLRIDEVDFTRHYQLPSEDVIRYRDGTSGRLPVSCMVLPIGVVTPVGVLVLENFRSAAAFTAEDQALIGSLVQQTALTLDNARAKEMAQALYQSAEARAAQLQALTEVSAAITSSLHTDELIASVLDSARAILPYDTGTLWIRSALRGEDRLTVRAVRGFELAQPVERSELSSGQPDDRPPSATGQERLGLSVVASESLLLREMITTGRPILVPDVRTDARFPSIVPPHYLSWLGVPLISKGEVVGVIALEKTEAGFYTSEHIQVVTTFSGQASVALENANLYEESLARAAELDRRSQRLALLHRLSTELGSSLDATYILQLTVQELLLAVNGTGGAAFLFDTAGEILLQAESLPSDWASTMPTSLDQNLGAGQFVPYLAGELPVVMPSAPLFDHVRASMGVLIIKDITTEPGWFAPSGEAAGAGSSPLARYLSSRFARSLLVLPLATGNDLHGLLFIHHRLPDQFIPEEIDLARTISNQAAVAVQNAALFQETQWLFAETRQRSAELATLFDLGVNISQVLDRQKLIDITFENILHLMQVNSVGLVMAEPEPVEGESGLGELVAQAVENGQRIGPISLPRKGQSYSEWVLSTGSPLLIGDLVRDAASLPVSGYTVGTQARSWLGVPLMVRGAVTGVLAAQSEEPDHFGESHLRLLGQIGNQLAVALDNARLFGTVQGYAADLEQRVAERTAQLAREHQRTQTLLGIITELSTSLDMDIVLNRTLALINETVGAERSMIMLVLPDESTLYLRATLGYVTPAPSGGQTTSLRPDEGLAGWAISNRQPTLVGDLWLDPRWTGARLGEGLEPAPAAHRSAIAVPLMMGEETLGALLLFHDEPNRFSSSQLDLVQATAKQIAVAINNAQLYTLIRDQAERLGDMLRRQHIETSRSQAILEAVADGVLVTDANRVITVFNASAERILGLSREAVIGQSLEHFLGLFGSAGQSWMDTIRRWSVDPGSIRPGSAGTSSSMLGSAAVADSEYTYTEHIELEDLRVVSVHLSPVRLRNDFLGTVSTFRDITHQVVVDRLKSEFVATVSHELRTPMTSIKGYVEILLMGAAGKMTDQQTRFLEIVKSNTERLAVLVNDLLDISRIEAGRVTLSLQPLDLRQLARDVAGDYIRRNDEENKRMDIQISCPPELPRVLGDAERVRQILDNLLDNAYSYTPAGGRITLTLRQTNGEIQVDIQDNGIGILLEDQPRIFERFYRGENPLVLSTSGTGLGLSIVRHLVEMHKGRIWLKSNGLPGEGSTFSFTLPIYQAGDL
jgi:GAF domain-containing protein/nitrogen-specific signal transduction histidine kinase